MGSTALGHIPSLLRLDLSHLFNLYPENDEALDIAVKEIKDARRKAGLAERVDAARRDGNGKPEASPGLQGNCAIKRVFTVQNLAPAAEHDKLLSQDDEKSSTEQFEDPNPSPPPTVLTKSDLLSRPNIATPKPCTPSPLLNTSRPSPPTTPQ